MGLALRTYATNCFGNSLKISQESWVLQRLTVWPKDQRFGTVGLIFRKPSKLWRFSSLLWQLWRENSHWRCLEAAFFFVHNVPWPSVLSKPMKTKWATRMMTPKSLIKGEAQKYAVICLVCWKEKVAWLDYKYSCFQINESHKQRYCEWVGRKEELHD